MWFICTETCISVIDDIWMLYSGRLSRYLCLNQVKLQICEKVSCAYDLSDDYSMHRLDYDKFAEKISQKWRRRHPRACSNLSFSPTFFSLIIFSLSVDLRWQWDDGSWNFHSVLHAAYVDN